LGRGGFSVASTGKQHRRTGETAFSQRPGDLVEVGRLTCGRKVPSVVAQLRIYDIKAGLMDDWLVLFQDKIAPLHEKCDIRVHTAWVDEARGKFIWVREFAGEGTQEEQEQRYIASPERAEVIGDEPKRFIEAMEVHEVTTALGGRQ